MRITISCLAVTAFLLVSGCAPFDEIYSHEFSSGYFKLKRTDASSENVYLKETDDSLIVYPVTCTGSSKKIELSLPRVEHIANIGPGEYLYNSTFVKTSPDIDLSSVVLKFRPAAANVPPQLNANVNGVIYTGFRKDYFKIKVKPSWIDEELPYIRQTGFDFGIFAGIGITPVNPTVTGSGTMLEYDGIIFQKGFSVFATYEHISVGLALGFDNLLDHNKSVWIYNNKPWIGLVLGIANF